MAALRLNTKVKIFLAVVVLVIVAEVAWVGSVFLRPKVQSPGSSLPVSGVQSQAGTTQPSSFAEAVISLKSSKTAYKVGEKIPVSIDVRSNKPTDGVDVIVFYDPNLLSVESSNSKQAVQLGKIYTDYPINIVDQRTGKISVSGVTTRSSGVVPGGVMGTITFVAKAAGEVKVSVDFIPGSTIDSNVTETNTAKDLLGRVDNLELSIAP